MHHLKTKDHWLNLRTWYALLSSLFFTIGLLWTPLKAIDMFGPEVLELERYWLPFWIAVTVITLCAWIRRTWPCTKYSNSNKALGAEIILRIGDILSLEDSHLVVVSSNTEFKVNTNRPSLKGQVLKEHLGNDPKKMESFLFHAADSQFADGRFGVGTVAYFPNEGEPRFCFVAVSSKVDGKSETQPGDLNTALRNLWSALAKGPNSKPIAMTLIGAGRGQLRRPNTKYYILDRILDSFINESKKQPFCRQLVVFVARSVSSTANIDMNTAKKYVDFYCLKDGG